MYAVFKCSTTADESLVMFYIFLFMTAAVVLKNMVAFQSFGALAAVASTITSMSLASPLVSESAAAHSIQKRQNDFFVVHPIEDGGVQPRLNIRDLAGKSENKELWALYILAIKRLQAVDQKEKLSYYQVAGKCSRINVRSS